MVTIILPFEIKTVEKEKNRKLLEAFIGELQGFVPVGPKGYLFPLAYKDEAHNIYNMAVKPNDLFMMGYLRSGKVGGWREYFDEEMQAQARAWIADNLRGSDFKFPHMDTV